MSRPGTGTRTASPAQGTGAGYESMGRRRTGCSARRAPGGTARVPTARRARRLWLRSRDWSAPLQCNSRACRDGRHLSWALLPILMRFFIVRGGGFVVLGGLVAPDANILEEAD